MKKTELRFAEHTKLKGHAIVELWYDNQFIGQVTGGDGPAVRVMSKFPMEVISMCLPSHGVVTHCIETRIHP